MRINGKFPYGIDKMDSQPARKKDAQKSSTVSDSSAQVDKVSLSSRGKDAVALTQALKSAPEVRADKVEDLRQRIADGSYAVSGRVVAEKIVKTAMDDLF